MGGARAITIWENCDDRISYDGPVGHTFSLYLRNGTGTRRLDGATAAGWPGAVCIMPEGHRSEWEITSAFRFVHLYLPDAGLRAAFAWTHDCDARQLDLRDQSFIQAPELAAPLADMARAACDEDILRADVALAELIARIPARRPVLHGGLPPRVLRRLDDWIDTHLDQPIRLVDLARLADLSEFHLHRMFRLSRGLAPHAWVRQRRIDRAKTLLRGDDPLGGIAATCGFSSQSHMTRAFKGATGVTPARYRALL